MRQQLGSEMNVFCLKQGQGLNFEVSQLIPTHFSFQPLSNPIGGFHAHAIQKNHNHSPGPFNI